MEMMMMMMMMLTAKQGRAGVSSRIVLVSYTTNRKETDMQYSNYKDSIRHMANLESFRSNSMLGQMGNKTYIVFSYATAIAWIARDCSKAFVNVHKYSVTTSKHQTYVKQAIKELRYKHPEMEVVEFDGFLADEVTA